MSKKNRAKNGSKNRSKNGSKNRSKNGSKNRFKKRTTKKRKRYRSLKKFKKKVKKSISKTIKKIKEKILLDKRLKKKFNIKDVPLDSDTNKGTKASSDFIDYHYQRLDNIINYLYKEFKNKNHNIYFFKSLEDSILEIEFNNQTVKPCYIGNDDFITNIRNSVNSRFVPLTLNSLLSNLSHANVILIDNELKNVEFFEPHGYKKDQSTLDGVSKAYNKKNKLIKLYFSEILPDYKFINVNDFFKKEGFQMKHDARHGYCVTWSLLYVHYRLLNPNTPVYILIKYLYYHINLSKLLRYARYIEKVLKI